MRFTIMGVEASPGVYRGAAVVGWDGAMGGCRGAVLVAPTADPGLTRSFAQAGAIVCEVGSPLGNLATVAREQGIPLVLAVRGATRRIRTGDLVSVDACRGLVTVERAESAATPSSI